MVSAGHRATIERMALRSYQLRFAAPCVGGHVCGRIRKEPLGTILVGDNASIPWERIHSRSATGIAPESHWWSRSEGGGGARFILPDGDHVKVAAVGGRRSSTPPASPCSQPEVFEVHLRLVLSTFFPPRFASAPLLFPAVALTCEISRHECLRRMRPSRTSLPQRLPPRDRLLEYKNKAAKPKPKKSRSRSQVRRRCHPSFISNHDA